MTAALAERQQAAGGFADPMDERLLRGAGIGRGMQVLDLDCGAGDVSLLAAKLTGPNGLVLGVDQDPAILEIARSRAHQQDLGHVYFLEAADGPYDQGPFDAVIARHILDRAENPVTAFRNLSRLLRPGGVLALHESSPAVMQTLEKAGFASPQLFGATISGRPEFCVWARKPE